MTIVAVVGDAATTSAVALAAGWPTDDGANDGVTVVEADPGGGSLAGWLDTPAHPTLATIVANVGVDTGRSHDGITDTVAAMTHRSASGVRFVANAVRARAAHRAVEEAAGAVFPAIAAATTTVIADVGAHRAGQHPSPALRLADVVVIVHRQATASAAAATVRVERLAETVEELAHLDATFVLTVIGSAPFDPVEIGSFVDGSVPDTIRFSAVLADDPLAAATIAGRAGVSERRLRRLPLMRDASRLAGHLSDLVDNAQRRGTHPLAGTIEGPT
jgi:hypothetical protein